MAHHDDEGAVAQPQIFTLHWEGPSRAQPPPEHRLVRERAALDAEQGRELDELRRTHQGRALWEQIEREARQRGDAELWRRKLHAYAWVKMRAQGSAGDYARAFDANHATVRTWIADVGKLAYEVGYRLHEDKLLLVGEAPERLRRLRELVNRDAASPQAWSALEQAAAEFRGRDPYFHLNEGHVLRAHGRLRESDVTLKEGLTIAEARRIRSLLWNARGQTLWDCTRDSDHPLPDHLERAERCFRRAAALDSSTWFAHVNLAQLAVDAGDPRRAEYWISELATARKRMDDDMKDGLARYLEQAEWTRSVEARRFWRNGPLKWVREAAKRGALAVLALLWLGAAMPFHAAADPGAASPDAVELGRDGGRGGDGAGSGAGGN